MNPFARLVEPPGVVATRMAHPWFIAAPAGNQGQNYVCQSCPGWPYPFRRSLHEAVGSRPRATDEGREPSLYQRTFTPPVTACAAKVSRTSTL